MNAPPDLRDALIACLAERFNRLPGQCGGHADALIAEPLARLISSAADADRWGSEYADAMDARMADAITMERVGSALAVFARMDAMDPPEGVRLNDWLPAVTGARAALKESRLQRLLDTASGTVMSKARGRGSE